jgi:hypothetical protein
MYNVHRDPRDSAISSHPGKFPSWGSAEGNWHIHPTDGWIGNVGPKPGEEYPGNVFSQGNLESGRSGDWGDTEIYDGMAGTMPMVGILGAYNGNILRYDPLTYWLGGACFTVVPQAGAITKIGSWK